MLSSLEAICRCPVAVKVHNALLLEGANLRARSCGKHWQQCGNIPVSKFSMHQKYRHVGEAVRPM